MITSEKSTLAYTPPSTAPPVYDASEAHQPTLQGYPPTPSYAYPPTTPQQEQYKPPQSQAPQTQPLSTAQIGEQYRAELFAKCAAGAHEPRTRFGVCGIITGVLLFPIGLICLFADSERKCDRCGVKLS
ncbi:hypothetical protein FB45DRAFT_512507 [Roridomyces roridus]|uniref:Brain protein I3 n=1 Tax=Roridomyces roridus TaxID=1738132 RepID=A0AAD7FQX0_9AGAR|nr:hypothetical protein FB45DRAFT_512507 [Roridomyces roridus]